MDRDRTNFYPTVLGSMIKERIHDLETGVASQPKSQPKSQPCVPSRTNSKLVPTRPRPPGGQINNTNITVNRTVNKTVNKTVVNGPKQSSGLTSIPGIDSKMVERILAEKLEPTNQKME